MRSKIKVCSMLLVMALLVTSAKQITAFANVGSIQPRWTQTTSISSILSITKEGVACANGTVIGIIGRTSKMNGFLYLQKKNGSSWSNVYTWTGSETDSSLVVSGEKSSIGSGTYRARFVAYVYEGSKVEEVEMISSEKTY